MYGISPVVIGLAADELALLPKKEAYFAKRPVPSIASHDAYPRASSDLITKHRYPLMAKQPRLAPGGGTQRTVTVEDFPISSTMAGSVIELEPGGLREMHWHPNADEWQYYLDGVVITRPLI